MADLRLADAGATNTSLPVVIDGLDNHATTYTQLLIKCTNGTEINVKTGGGSKATGYYTTPAQFTGLTPGSVYGFRVEAIWEPGTRVVPIPANGTLRYFTTTGSPPIPSPGTPSLYFSSVNKNVITWRITAGSNTTRLEIDRSWAPIIDTALNSNETWYWSYTGSPGTTYGIRVRGYNSTAGYGPWTSFSYGTTEAEIVVGGIGPITVTNTLFDRFTLTWGNANNASSYLVQYKKQSDSAWTGVTTTNYYYTVTDLVEATYYDVRVRGYSGDINGPFSTTTVRTQNSKPTLLNWTTFNPELDITITAKNWNDMTSKINAWLLYKGKNTRTMATAYTGNNITAAMFNDVVDRMVELGITTTIPSKVSYLDDITAAKLNAIGVGIDSLT